MLMTKSQLEIILNSLRDSVDNSLGSVEQYMDLIDIIHKEVKK